jgi:hypothetical protein
MTFDDSDLIRLWGLTDKFNHGYFPVYQDLRQILGPAASVLEVGVARGGSLRLWQELFPDSPAIAGADNYAQLDTYGTIEWPEGAHKIEISQDAPGLGTAAGKICPEGWDLIIDDASHLGSKSIATFMILWEHVKPGGFYVIEDWFVGEEWNPLYPRYEGSSMSDFAKSFVHRLYPNGDIRELRYVATGNGIAIIRKY